jgi:hypothetical protein
VNGSSAGENVDISQTLVEVRDAEIAGSACSEGSKFNVVSNSVDSHLYVDKHTSEIRMSKNEKLQVKDHGTEENHDGSNLINVRGINQSLRILVDTGAQISMLKRSLIPANSPINTDTQYEIAGITTGSIKALGSVELTLHDGACRFQVAPEEIQLNEGGLTSRDILKDSVIHNRESYIDVFGHKHSV